MTQLFEYHNWEKVEDSESLKRLLREIWSERSIESDAEADENADSKYQPFFQFDKDQIKANNYVGFIQNRGQLIEIYPKVFRDLESPDRNLMLKHIFYWFSYCRKWRFPFNQAHLDQSNIDSFPELIIYLIANQFLETVSQQPFLQYHPLEERTSTPRGNLNFSRYIAKSLVTGNYHQLECDHEPFLYDNKVNRTIKYCSRLLLDQTRYAETQRLLQEVIFVLDEVDDIPTTARDVDSIKLNPFFHDYSIVMEMCKTILNQQIYSNNAHDFSQWCLLFPMEYIFEDFVAGFMETHFSSKWRVEYQKSDEFLSSNPKAFNLQHDIFLTAGERKIIIDTKYKIRRYDPNDIKKGVIQSDLYQIVSYAYRRGCTEAFLIYPNSTEKSNQVDQFVIPSGFPGADIIKVSVLEIPFWSIDNFNLLTSSLKNVLKEVLE
jgi:5-methylcytosine-specific restriction enzyme subunit McrC